MAALTDFVDVTVTLSAQSPSRQTFAVPLIAGFHTRFVDLVRTYRKIADMEADGFVATDAEHKVATSLLSQNPTVPSFKVGRLTGVQTPRLVKLLANAVSSTAYAVSINGTTYTFTSDSSATAAEIATGLVALINAGSEPVTASVDTNNLLLTADVDGPDFYVDVADASLWSSIQDTSLVRSSISADLAAILASDSAWYGLLLTRNNHLDAALAATFAQSNKRIFAANAINFGGIVSAQNCLASNTTSLPGVLKAASQTRALSLFSKHDANHAVAGLLGVVFPKVVGSWTADAKTIAGSVADSLTTTEQTNLEANRCNHYQPVNDVGVVQKGVMASARFFDEIVISDWTEARIKEEIFAAQLFLDKIPFTEAGAGIIRSCVMRVLQEGVDNGAFVAGSIYCRTPTISAVSSVDKAARLLDGVEFGAVLAGAIHKTVLRGNLAP